MMQMGVIARAPRPAAPTPPAAHIWGAVAIAEKLAADAMRAGPVGHAIDALARSMDALTRDERLPRGFRAELRRFLNIWLRVGLCWVSSRGGPVENVLRWAGKFAPTGVVPAMVTGGAAAAFGGRTAAALAGTGLAARGAATALARRNADRARQLMVAGKSPPRPPRSPVSAALSARSSTVGLQNQLLDLLGIKGGG
jgi:hypothetical protein